MFQGKCFFLDKCPDLIMETSAEIRAVHPTVASQEPAAFAEGETVDLVVAEELVLARHEAGPRPRGLVVVGAGEVRQVCQAGGGQRPLEAAVTQQGVAGQLEHLARSCPGRKILGNHGFLEEYIHSCQL